MVILKEKISRKMFYINVVNVDNVRYILQRRTFIQLQFRHFHSFITLLALNQINIPLTAFSVLIYSFSECLSLIMLVVSLHTL